MQNCLVMGSGRSGTSLVSGILNRAGYYMGDNLMPATRANPKGFFESFDIEQINEDILRKSAQPTPSFLEPHPGTALAQGQLWLARVGRATPIESDDGIDRRIKREVSSEPFCFKDPRFSYTLPVWRPHLPENTMFLCVFRHPGATSQSILTQIGGSPLLNHLKFTLEDTLQIWEAMYSHILEIHRDEGNWLFLHYNQLFDSAVLDRIHEFTGAAVDESFPETKFSRSRPLQEELPERIENMYRTLCALAGMP